MTADPLRLFNLLSGGDLAASAAKLPRRGEVERGGIQWAETPFRDLSLIGRGAMGAVFRAHDLRVGRPVALKLMIKQSAKGRERFVREGRLAARLSHPNVLRVHDMIEFPQGDVLVCELLEGARPLDEAWRGSELLARVRLLRDAARGVAAAHALGIVHRDLKPENLLVDAEGQVRVTDFGIAYGDELGRLTQSGATLGTPSFMAPEQLGASASKVPTASADVWSLGVILYLALTDELPFVGSTLIEVIGASNSGYQSHHAGALAKAPAPLRALVASCLRVDPAERPQDAQAFLESLDGWLADPQRGGRGSRAGLGIGALALALAALAIPLLRSSPPTAGNSAQAPSALSSPGVPSASSPTPSTPTPSAKARPGAELAARIEAEVASGRDLGRLLADLERLRAAGEGLPRSEREALGAEILEQVAQRILASETNFDTDQVAALKALSQLGARIRPETGIQLADVYMSRMTLGNYAPPLQRALFDLFLRLDVPTPYLDNGQFKGCFGPLGPLSDASPWSRYANLRVRSEQPRAQRALRALLFDPPPDFELGPCQWAESIAILATEEWLPNQVSQLQEALRRDPHNPEAILHLARFHSGRGEQVEARANYERLLKALRARNYPKWRVTRNYFGRLLHHVATYFARQGDMARARALVDEGSLFPLSSIRSALLDDFPELR